METRNKFIYENLTAKKAEAIPWDWLLVYLIGTYKIRIGGHDKALILKLQ